MSLFEILAKIKLLNDLRIAFKSTNVFTRFMIIAGVITAGVGLYGYKSIKDNSIYVDNIDDFKIKEEIKYILTKCGSNHAIGISTISTETRTNYYAKFKEFWACDNNMSGSCLIDLLQLDKYTKDFNVDIETYNYLLQVAQEQDIEKINLKNFDSDRYKTINDILNLSINKDKIHTLWLTAVANKDKKIIYAIHMSSWSNFEEYACPDGRFLLNNLRRKLPLSKLWL
jgi:hypothetical protein